MRIRRTLLLTLLLSLAMPVAAQDPVRVGWPPCTGGETGLWQVYRRGGEAYLAVVLHDNSYENAANIVCFLRPTFGIQVIDTRRS